jgi:predicted nucleotidyltransferase
MELTQDTILAYLTTKKKEFGQQYSINKFGLFGSFARNEQTKESDIDIIYFLEKDKKITYFELFELEKKLENFFKRKIELINYQYINPIIKYKSQEDIIYV